MKQTTETDRLIKEIDKKIIKWVKEGELPYENKAIIRKIIELYNEKQQKISTGKKKDEKDG